MGSRDHPGPLKTHVVAGSILRAVTTGYCQRAWDGGSDFTADGSFRRPQLTQTNNAKNSCMRSSVGAHATVKV